MYFDHPIFGTLNYASGSEQWPLALEFMTMAEPSEARLNVSETTTIPKSFIWVNYNDLTATSLEIMVSKGNHPQMVLIQVGRDRKKLVALIQVSEIL